MTDIPGLNSVAVQRILDVTAMTCNAFRGSDHGNARPKTTGEGVRCLNCDDAQWRHWLRQALLSADHVASGGVGLIQAERQRQCDVEGFTATHDATHKLGELVSAAMCYAIYASHLTREQVPPLNAIASRWPWEAAWWKPSPDPILNLVKAGALIAAEIDRLVGLRESA